MCSNVKCFSKFTQQIILGLVLSLLSTHAYCCLFDACFAVKISLKILSEKHTQNHKTQVGISEKYTPERILKKWQKYKLFLLNFQFLMMECSQHKEVFLRVFTINFQ